MYQLLVTLLFVKANGKMIAQDLTYDFDNVTTNYWPGMVRFHLYLKANQVFEYNSFCASEHGGTHMDAPRHLVRGKHGITDIPVENLIGKNPFVVDVSMEASRNPDLQINRQHIENAENKNGNGILEEGAMVLLYTGWSNKWSNISEFYGGDPTNFSTFHFPGLEPEAATWLVNDKKIISVGIDTGSIDYGQSKLFQAHINLFKKNIPAFESVNLTGILELKKHEDLIVVALPMKIKDGSGAPLRIIAMYDDEIGKSKSSGRSSHSVSFNIIMFFLAVMLLI